MTCENREKDILLLAHGELDPWRRVLVKGHLRRCESCRRTLKEMRSVSGALGNVLCDPALPAWSSEGGFSGASSSAPWSSATRLVVIAALIAALFLVGFTLRGIQGAHRPRSAPPAERQDADQPCRPGLPHDRCR